MDKKVIHEEKKPLILSLELIELLSNTTSYGCAWFNIDSLESYIWSGGVKNRNK